MLAIAGALAFTCEVPARGQSPVDPQADESAIELSSNLVTLVVVVRDSSGALVTNLRSDQFAVYEDDSPQEIDRLFRQEELPLRLALLFDASLSVDKRIDFERRAADRFLAAALRPADQAALISVSTIPRIEQGLTSSLPALTSATSRLKADGVTLLYSALDLAAKTLSTADGRRAILIISDGNDVGSSITAKNALASVQRSDAVIYAIGTGPSATKTPTPLEAAGQGVLSDLCTQTGGQALFPRPQTDRAKEANLLDEAYAKILSELRAQQVLTYYSSSPKNDKGFRKLRIETKVPGLTVHARSGYYGR